TGAETMRGRDFILTGITATRALRVSCSSLGSKPLGPTLEMRRLSVVLLALFFLVAWPRMAFAQEAVSTTTTSGTSSSTSTSSSSTTSGGELSTGPAGPSAAVTNAPSAATSVQGGPSGVGVFSPTPVKIY